MPSPAPSPHASFPLPETNNHTSCDATHAPSALPFPGSAPALPASDPVHVLPADSHTAHRLLHATPEHLHATTRRVFVGPIPEGWLKSHRRDWYKRQLGIHYSSRQATFHAQEGTGRRRALTGLSDEDRRPRTSRSWHTPKSPDRSHLDPRPRTATASLSASHGALSFPQPRDLDDDDDVDEENDLEDVSEDPVGEAEAEAQTAPPNLEPETTPALLSPAATHEFLDDRPLRIRSSSEATVRSSGGPSMSARLRIEEGPRPQYKRQGSSAYSKVRKGSRGTSISSSSFVTAHEEADDEGDDDDDQSVLTVRGGNDSRNVDDDTKTETGVRPPDGASGPATVVQETSDDDAIGNDSDQRKASLVGSFNGTSTSGTPVYTGKQSSTSALLPRLDGQDDARRSSDQARLDGQDDTGGPFDQAPLAAPAGGKGKRAKPEATHAEGEGEIAAPLPQESEGKKPRTPSTAVTFNVPEDEAFQERRIRERLAQLKQRRTYKRLRRSKVHEGEIIKLANMLVRVEFTSYEMPPEYDENDSQKIELRTVDKWKEFMVVCRESGNDDAPFSLQMYQTRVISAVEKANQRRHSTHEIALERKTTRVNLFSSLDKTMVIWVPYRRGTMIYIMQARSGADSMEWYTFLRNVLGSPRTTLLQINVPDLDVNLRLDHPFEQLEMAREVAGLAESDDEAVLKTMLEEQAVAANIIARCMEMLRKSPQWTDILDAWLGQGRIGLAWKRYDRLEWIYGANEQKMYGTIAMEKSYDLELRPKQHYPTSVKDEKRNTWSEPPPVEGFLIRLTSQRGRDQRMGRLFFKRLYFSTHGHYLLFNRPNRAEPPAPPQMPTDIHAASLVPTAHTISQETPIIYSVNPYPLDDSRSHISWLDPAAPQAPSMREERDRFALVERERVIDTVLNCDGMINLCNVREVRAIQRGATPADAQIQRATDDPDSVDYHRPPPAESSLQDDGTTRALDDARTFEMVLNNDLTIRLQAFDATTAREWIERLRALVTYWRLRSQADTSLRQSVRQANLTSLNLDADAEAQVGQFARKWEVTNSHASPELHHMCSIASCRAISLSGLLYRKPRHSAPFEQNLVVLSHGHLLMFRDALRSRSGALQRHAHHDRVASLDLSDCYVYSGLVTESDLAGVSAPRATAGARPGSFALPRLYRDDGSSSRDEPSMCAFVVWCSTKHSWFRAPGDHERGDGARGRVRLVRSLGVTGRSVVFMTRSRAERDQWVLALGVEIERLARLGAGADGEVRMR